MTGMRHPELKLLFRKEYLRFFLLIHIPFYIWLFFNRDFPDFLATMDATIVLLAVLYSLLIRPMIMNGRAYYRKHYRTKTTGSLLSVVYTGIWFGTLLRSNLLIGNFLIQYFTFEKNDIPSLVAGMKQNYLNMNGAIAGIAMFCLFVYVLYYKDRYISTQEFSNRAMRYVKERGLKVEDAMEKVLDARQAELENNAILRVTSVVVKQESNSIPNTSNIEPSALNVRRETQSPPATNVVPFPITPLRRHSRK
jgi:hypothetical protein